MVELSLAHELCMLDIEIKLLSLQTQLKQVNSLIIGLQISDEIIDLIFLHQLHKILIYMHNGQMVVQLHLNDNEIVGVVINKTK